MKKIFYILLSMVLMISFLGLTACGDPSEEGGEVPACEHNWVEFTDKNSKICTICGAFDGIEVTNQGWDGALSEQTFDNVTINYTFVITSSVNFHDAKVGYKVEQVAKFADGKVLRSGNVYDSAGKLIEEEFFGFIVEHEEAVMQRKMFYDMFAALLSDYDNFVFDSNQGVYISPSEIKVDVSEGVGEISNKVIEIITNAKVKFGANGKLEYFESDHTEAYYDKNDNLESSISGKIIWTYSNYGTTVID